MLDAECYMLDACYWMFDARGATTDMHWRAYESVFLRCGFLFSDLTRDGEESMEERGVSVSFFFYYVPFSWVGCRARE